MSVVPIKTPSRRAETDSAPFIDDFQSGMAEIEGEPKTLRATLYALVALIVAAIIWACLARIDRVVVAHGKLVSTETAITLQPIETSILKSVSVKAGDVVRAGQVLATLDPTFTASDVGQLAVRIQMLDAQIARLAAEMANAPYEPAGTLPPEVTLTQTALWRSRQEHFQSQTRSYDERMARSLAMVTSNRRQARFYADQLTSYREIESIRNMLAANQTGSRLNALAATAGRLEAERNLVVANASAEEAEHELDDLKAQRAAFVGQWESETAQTLVQQRTERDGLVEQMQKARKRQQLVTLTAPVDSIVLEVANRSVNAVLREAEPLFTLAPMNAPLEVMAQIDGGDIGFVRAGDAVQVKFDAYSFLEHGAAKGVVLTISEDSFAGKSEQVGNQNMMGGADGGMPRAGSGLYYRARITLTDSALRNVPENHPLLPGMPLVADIKVGERTVISYLLRPLLGGVRESMREP